MNPSGSNPRQAGHPTTPRPHRHRHSHDHDSDGSSDRESSPPRAQRSRRIHGSDRQWRQREVKSRDHFRVENPFGGAANLAHNVNADCDILRGELHNIISRSLEFVESNPSAPFVHIQIRPFRVDGTKLDGILDICSELDTQLSSVSAIIGNIGTGVNPMSGHVFLKDVVRDMMRREAGLHNSATDQEINTFIKRTYGCADVDTYIKRYPNSARTAAVKAKTLASLFRGSPVGDCCKRLKTLLESAAKDNNTKDLANHIKTLVTFIESGFKGVKDATGNIGMPEFIANYKAAERAIIDMTDLFIRILRGLIFPAAIYWAYQNYKITRIEKEIVKLKEFSPWNEIITTVAREVDGLVSSKSLFADKRSAGKIDAIKWFYDRSFAFGAHDDINKMFNHLGDVAFATELYRNIDISSCVKGGMVNNDQIIDQLCDLVHDVNGQVDVDRSKAISGRIAAMFKEYRILNLGAADGIEGIIKTGGILSAAEIQTFKEIVASYVRNRVSMDKSATMISQIQTFAKIKSAAQGAEIGATLKACIDSLDCTGKNTIDQMFDSCSDSVSDFENRLNNIMSSFYGTHDNIQKMASGQTYAQTFDVALQGILELSSGINQGVSRLVDGLKSRIDGCTALLTGDHFIKNMIEICNTLYDQGGALKPMFEGSKTDIANINRTLEKYATCMGFQNMQSMIVAMNSNQTIDAKKRQVVAQCNQRMDSMNQTIVLALHKVSTALWNRIPQGQRGALAAPVPIQPQQLVSERLTSLKEYILGYGNAACNLLRADVNLQRKRDQYAQVMLNAMKEDRKMAEKIRVPLFGGGIGGGCGHAH